MRRPSLKVSFPGPRPHCTAAEHDCGYQRVWQSWPLVREIDAPDYLLWATRLSPIISHMVSTIGLRRYDTNVVALEKQERDQRDQNG